MQTMPEPRGPSGPVLVLSSNPDLVEQLRPQLTADGLGLTRVHSLGDLIVRIAPGAGPHGASPRAALVLIDTADLADPQELLALAPLVDTAEGQNPPLLCLASETDLRGRLAALRAGAVELLPGDSDPSQVLQCIRSLMGAARGAPPRILIVDDQPVSALFAARVLEGAGMVTERVENPLAVLDVLQRLNPDLVVMDLHMPGASGIELTRIIRDHARFADLPIVFLSVELDPDQQLNALRVGGDDFLAKPVPPGVLVDCVRRRLALARRRAARTPRRGVLDPVSGLASREHLFERLDRQLGAGARPEWALIYLEHAWDQSLFQRMVALLRDQAEPEDLLARVGEHGLAILIRRAEPEVIGRFARTLADALHGALKVEDPGRAAFGIGWCPLHPGGDEAVTLVSQARKAAQLGLRGGTGGPVPYLRAVRSVSGQERGPILGALEASRFQLLYQPILDLWDVARERYEATLRLRLADGELLPPRAFAPLVVRSGLAEQVDRWTLTACLDALAACRVSGRSVELLVPQTMTSLAAPQWLADLRESINTRDLIRSRPLIEIELVDADRNLPVAARQALELERLGIRLCIGGFCDGPRGDRVLAALPVALVRLALVGTRDWRAERLKDLVGRIQGRGGRVIAAGADAPETIARVCAAGVTLIQGPFVQPPLESMRFDFASTGPGA